MNEDERRLRHEEVYRLRCTHDVHCNPDSFYWTHFPIMVCDSGFNTRNYIGLRNHLLVLESKRQGRKSNSVILVQEAECIRNVCANGRSVGNLYHVQVR